MYRIQSLQKEVAEYALSTIPGSPTGELYFVVDGVFRKSDNAFLKSCSASGIDVNQRMVLDYSSGKLIRSTCRINRVSERRHVSRARKAYETHIVIGNCYHLFRTCVLEELIRGDYVLDHGLLRSRLATIELSKGGIEMVLGEGLSRKVREDVISWFNRVQDIDRWESASKAQMPPKLYKQTAVDTQ